MSNGTKGTKGDVVPKDLEGVTQSFGSSRIWDGDAIPPPPRKRNRQKKIAVLTSGGDSAGMNAAGGY